MPNNPPASEKKEKPAPNSKASTARAKENQQEQDSKILPPLPASKRDEFRLYLEKTGVLDALTRVLVGLYEEPEKPNNPIEYFLERLAIGVPLKQQLLDLTAELEQLQEKFKEVDADNVRLKADLQKHGIGNALGKKAEEFKVPDVLPPPGADDDIENLPTLSNVN